MEIYWNSQYSFYGCHIGRNGKHYSYCFDIARPLERFWQQQSSQITLEIVTNWRFTFHSKLVSKLLVRPLPVRSHEFHPFRPPASLPWDDGMPKGAIVSPLLFCIYMNDLPFTSQNCSLESYVDDTKVYLSFSLLDSDTAVTKLEQDLHRVATCCSWGYSLWWPIQGGSTRKGSLFAVASLDLQVPKKRKWCRLTFWRRRHVDAHARWKSKPLLAVLSLPL